MAIKSQMTVHAEAVGNFDLNPGTVVCSHFTTKFNEKRRWVKNRPHVLH